MKGKKLTACTHTHRYATRSTFRAAVVSQVSGVEQYIVQNPGLVACKKRRKGERKIPYLPKDIIFRILLLLPAKVLHEIMRYICREWYNIVNDPAFIRVHLQMSSYTGILVQHHIKQDLALYLELNSAELGLQVTEVRIPFAAKVVGSCNGLLLLHNYCRKHLQYFHVVNLVTKVKVSLPPFVRIRKAFTGFRSSLSYTSSTGHYKVVYVSGDLSEIKMMVCTVGVDTAWRSIDLGNIPMNQFSRNALLGCPHSIEGCIYWNWLNHFHPNGFALDVEDERVYRLPVPDGYNKSGPCCHSSYRIYMKTSFGMITHCCGTGMQEIWELIDVKSGKWAKVGDLDKEALIDRLRKMVYPRKYKESDPFLYLKDDGELWLRVFVDGGFILAYYNMRKGDILLGPTIDCVYDDNVYPHLNSLLSFKSC